MSPANGPRSLADLRTAATAVIKHRLGPDTIRVNAVLPDQLGLLGGDFGGYHDQYHQILLRPDMWSSLEQIVEGHSHRLDATSSFFAVSTYHHEHIHAAGPSTVGPMYGYASIRIARPRDWIAA